MPNCTFHIVDAFTAVPFTGNPWRRGDGRRRHRARRHAAHRARDQRPGNGVRVGLRQGGRACPLFHAGAGKSPLRGIPPLATGHLLRELGVLKPGTARFEFAIGVLPVDIRPDRVIMTQPPAVPDTCADAGTMAPSARASGFRSPGRASVPAHAGGRQLPDGSRPGACRRSGGSTWTGPPSKLFWRPSACRRRTCSPPKAWSLKRMCTPGSSIRTTPGKILSPDRPPGAWLPTCTAHGLCSGTRIRLEQGHILDRREPGNWN